MSKVFDFVRVYRRWIGAGLACIAFAVLIPSISSYRRMQRVFQAVRAQGAFPLAEFRGPAWLSETLDYIPPVKRLLQTHVRYIEYVEQRSGQSQPVDLSYLRDAPTVEVLNLRFAPEISDADLEFVGALPGLKHLDIHGPKVTNAGVRHLASLRQLESLCLTETLADDDGLSALKRMSCLRVLCLDKTAALTSLEQIHVAALERLVANRTSLGDEGISPLRDTGALQVLWLNDTQVTDDGLQHIAELPKLSTLGLKGTRITDSGIAKLSNLNQLRLLSLTRTAVSREACERLVERLPRLSIAYGPDDDHPGWLRGPRAGELENGPDSE